MTFPDQGGQDGPAVQLFGVLCRFLTYEQILNSDHEMAPGLDKLTMDSPAPLQADANGRYPIPRPGITNDREY